MARRALRVVETLGNPFNGTTPETHALNQRLNGPSEDFSISISGYLGSDSKTDLSV